jgi:hypothetical protein
MTRPAIAGPDSAAAIETGAVWAASKTPTPQANQDPIVLVLSVRKEDNSRARAFSAGED